MFHDVAGVAFVYELRFSHLVQDFFTHTLIYELGVGILLGGSHGFGLFDGMRALSFADRNHCAPILSPCSHYVRKDPRIVLKLVTH